MSPAAAGLAAGLVLGAVLQAGGARIRLLLRLPVPPGLRLPVELVLGSGVLGGAVLVAGLAGALRPLVLLAIAVAMAAGGSWRGLVSSWRRAWPGGAASLPLLLVAVQKPFFYDALVYHLGLPWQALVEGALRPHPADLFAAFPPLAQLVYAVPLAAGLATAPAVAHWILFVAAATAVTALARAAGAPRTPAALAGAAFVLLPTHVLVPGFPAAEGWALAAMLSALTLAVRWRDRPGTAWLIGGLCGLAVAARLQGLPWAVIVGALAMMPPGHRMGRGLRVAAGIVVGSASWWVKNLVLLSNPIAPLLWHREGMDTLWRDAASSFRGGTSLISLARSLPSHLAPAGALLGPLVLAAVYAIVRTRGRRQAALGGASLAGLAAWQLTGALPRFLAPTLAVVLALAAAAAVTAAGRTAARLALVWCLLLGSLATARSLVGPLGATLVASVAGRPASSLVVNDPGPAFRACARLPAGAKVLFVGEPRPFGFPRDMTVSSQHDVSPLRDPVERLATAEAVRSWLRKRGFTHLLINRSELMRLAPSYPVAPWRTVEGARRFHDLLTELGPPVVESGSVDVYALRPAAGGPGV